MDRLAGVLFAASVGVGVVFCDGRLTKVEVWKEIKGACGFGSIVVCGSFSCGLV